MRVLLTGGFGFIGSRFVRLLLDSGEGESGWPVEQVVNLDKVTYAANPDLLADLSDDPRLLSVRGDICDAGLLAGLFSRHDFDAVVHLAAESHVDRSIDSPEAFVRTNVLGTFHLLEAARNHCRHRPAAAKEKRFLFLNVSTDEVYGSLPPRAAAFTEADGYAPNNPYAASKAGAAHLGRAYFHTYGLPVITANGSNNYGPGQFPEKLIPLMISKILRGETLPVYGDGLQVRDWLHVDDYGRALLAMLHQGRPGEVYHVGGRCELTNLEVIHRLVALVNEHLPPDSRRSAEALVRFVPDRPGHDRRYAIDCSKIERELGWNARETADSGFRKTVQWYLEHPEWMERIADRYRGERLGRSL